MKHFLYIREQSGGGCDYTIGCGVDIERISAMSREDAIEAIINLPESWKEDLQESFEEGNVEDCFTDCISDSGLSDARPGHDQYKADRSYLVEITGEIDIMPILKAKLKEITDLKNELLSKSKEKEERAQYEKLKKKFEK